MKKIRVFECFSGIGAQHEGWKRLQADYPDQVEFEFVGTSEIDKWAIISYKAAHGNVPNYGSICDIDWGGVPDFDVLTYSFPCFVKGTLIHTQRGFIPIENVTKEDSVLTHTNNYQSVLKIGRRVNAPIIKVRGMCFKDLICTPNHPFYVRKRYRDWNNSKCRWERKFTSPEWLAAELLSSDCYVGYAINQKSEMPKWDGIVSTRWKKKTNQISSLFENPSFWYVIGRYVGDGWKKTSRTGSGIIICCSKRNKESLLDAIKSVGWIPTINEDRTATKVIISSNELHAFVDRYGYKAYGKSIDEETINLPIHLLQSFVNGYVDADGCFTENEFKASSVSEKLMYGIQQCISKAYKCPVRMYWYKRSETTTIEGRPVNQRDSYSIAWHIERRKQDKAFYEDGYVWFPIKEVINLNERATVYNMEVENDNSYTANGAIVHNCTDISNAGLQRGFSEDSGTSSSLLWECRRAIETKKPQWLLMENVKALTQKKFMPEFQLWIDWLDSQGYANFWKVLNSKNHGNPQNRERVFMISILRTEYNPNPTYNFPNPFPLEKRLKDVLEKNVDECYYLKQEQVDRIIEHCKKKQAEGCGFKENFN